jgi:hypothetical protein
MNGNMMNSSDRQLYAKGNGKDHPGATLHRTVLLPVEVSALAADRGPPLPRQLIQLIATEHVFYSFPFESTLLWLSFSAEVLLLSSVATAHS